MTHLDLFSGIGGFALAASWAWEDHEVVAFCEIDEYCQKVLGRHWPDVPIVSDIRELTYEGLQELGKRPVMANSESGRRGVSERVDVGPGQGEINAFGSASEDEDRVSADTYFERFGKARGTESGGGAQRQSPRIDILTGGFPCQPFSAAGKREGREDDRFLWPEMVRCIQEFQPRWVVGENVAGIYSMEDVFEQIHTDLERCGYEVQAIRIPACAVGAHHRRDRWWFVAHAERERPRGWGNGDSGERERQVQTEGLRRREESGLLAHADLAGLEGRDGGELRERGGELPAWAGGSWPQPWPVSEWIATDTESVHAQGRENGSGQIESGGSDSGELREIEQVWPFTHPDRSGSEGPKLQFSDLPTESSRSEIREVWPPVGGVRGIFDGLSAGMDGYTAVRNRTNRLKALGNAIVPQVAYEIFRAIQQIELDNL